MILLQIELPQIVNYDPLTIALALGFATGLAFGRAFKGLDHAMQETENFKKLGPFSKWFAKSFFDAFHHWQIGLFVMLIAKQLITSDPILLQLVYCLGLGMFISDLADYKNIVKRYTGASL